jgi:hypothetical protein
MPHNMFLEKRETHLIFLWYFYLKLMNNTHVLILMAKASILLVHKGRKLKHHESSLANLLCNNPSVPFMMKTRTH